MKGQCIMYEVYMIVNKINQMKYVGATSRGYVTRFRKHISSASCGSTAPIHCAIREYGEDAFDLVLLESNIPKSEVCDKERYYIDLYDTKHSTGHGYNVAEGGGGNLSYVYTDEVRSKMGEVQRGTTYSAERNEKIRKAMTGRDYKPEWRQALSKARQGRFIGEANSFYGKHHTDLTKSKIHAANSKYNIYQYDKNSNDLINVFDCAMSAARWVVEHGYSKAKPDTCNTRILYVCRHSESCSAYGFIWKLEVKSID